MLAPASDPGLGDMVGVKVPIRPRQGQILVTERLDGLVSKNYAEFGYLAAKSGKKRPGVTPEMEQFGVAMVLEPSAAGTVLIGSSRRFVGMDTTPHPAVMQAIAQRAKHFFPAFSSVKLIRAYAGVRPASPDGKPIISPTMGGRVCGRRA
ncbi:MAG: NAD(P)/FAD-dependent oxidoreductase [Bilophila wadsworthia]